MASLFQLALNEGKYGILLYRVADGSEGLAFLRKYSPYQNAPVPDLIVLDLNLPWFSGFEMLEACRHIDRLRDIPVVVFSSSSKPDDRRTSLGLGAADFVTKPNDLNEFFAVVKLICDKMRVRANVVSKLSPAATRVTCLDEDAVE